MTQLPAPPNERFKPDHCANCFEQLPTDPNHRPHLFCSELCRDYASLVRYWRSVVRDGRFEQDPEVRYAVQIQIAHLLAGGYHGQARTIPAETRALVKERDKVCVSCGGPGEEIDHVDGDSNDPGNLQLLCKDCHHGKTAENLVPASTEQMDFVQALFLERVVPEEPARLCDGSDWRQTEARLRAERRERLVGPPKWKRRNSLDPSTITWLT